MAEVKGTLIVKDKLAVDGNAVFSKGLNSPYLELMDKKNSESGSFAGDDNTGAWKNRDLTDTVHNDFATSITLSALAGDNAEFTIPAGTYHIEASVPANEVGRHVGRLADITDASGQNATTVVLGTMEFAPDSDLWKTTTPDEVLAVADAAQTRSHIEGRFTVSRSTDLQIQHLGSITKNGDGFGVAAQFYDVGGYVGNVFTNLKMWQVVDAS